MNWHNDAFILSWTMSLFYTEIEDRLHTVALFKMNGTNDTAAKILRNTLSERIEMLKDRKRLLHLQSWLLCLSDYTANLSKIFVSIIGKLFAHDLLILSLESAFFCFSETMSVCLLLCTLLRGLPKTREPWDDSLVEYALQMVWMVSINYSGIHKPLFTFCGNFSL